MQINLSELLRIYTLICRILPALKNSRLRASNMSAQRWDIRI